MIAITLEVPLTVGIQHENNQKNNLEQQKPYRVMINHKQLKKITQSQRSKGRTTYQPPSLLFKTHDTVREALSSIATLIETRHC